MEAIFLFLIIFSFYCCLYNDMQHNYGTKIAISSGKSIQVNIAELTQKKLTQTKVPQQPEPVERVVPNPTNEAIEQLPISEEHIDPTPRTMVVESLVLGVL